MLDPANGAAVMGPVGNPIVTMLEQLLVEARAGRVSTLGVVVVNPTGGVAAPFLGPQICELYTGTGMLQGRIMRQIEEPQKRSSIIPARMG